MKRNKTETGSYFDTLEEAVEHAEMAFSDMVGHFAYKGSKTPFKAASQLLNKTLNEFVLKSMIEKKHGE